MADSVQLPVAEGGASGKGGTNWLLLGAMGVGGFLLLFILMRGGKSGSTSGTTAAGTSINAALGSIQEQQLNLMGQVGTSTGKLGGEIAGVGSQVAASHADLTGQLNQVNAGVVAGNQGAAASAKQYYDLLTGQLTGIGGQVTGVSGQVAGVGNQVVGIGTKIDSVSGQIVADTTQSNANATGLSAALASLWQVITANDAGLSAALSGIAAHQQASPSPVAAVQQAWQPRNTGRTPGASGPGGIWNNPSTGHPY